MSLAVSMSTVTPRLTCVCPRQALACCRAFSFRCQSDVGRRRLLPMEDFATEDFARASTDPTVPRCRGSRRPSTSKSDSVSSWLSRAMFCFIRRKYSVVQRQLYPPRNSFTLRHLLYRRRPVPTKSTSSSSMSSSSPSSCTSVFDRGVIFLSPMEFRSASSERGADESTGRKSQTRRNPHVSPGMFPGSFLC